MNEMFCTSYCILHTCNRVVMLHGTVLRLRLDYLKCFILKKKNRARVNEKALIGILISELLHSTTNKKKLSTEHHNYL